MKYIELGTQKKRVSTIMMGCMRIAGMEQKAIEELVESALKEGINAFDHADIYGQGESERSFGRLLATKAGLRDQIFLQSKCGIRNGFFDFSKDYILSSVDSILERLRTDHLDALLLHRPDALLEPEEVAEAFNRLKKEGKVLDFGVSNMNPMQMELLQRYMEQPLIVDQLQFGAAHTVMLDAGFHVNMADEAGCVRDGSALEYCRLHDIGIQAWSVLQYGYFEGTFLESSKYKKLNETLEQIGREYNVDRTTIAIAWILRYPGKMQTVIGSTKPERIHCMAQAAQISLSRQEWYEIYCAAGNVLP